MAPSMRLDRSKYFATVYGEVEDATRFWQNGLPFDAAGEIVAGRLTDDQIKELGAPRARAAATSRRASSRSASKAAGARPPGAGAPGEGRATAAAAPAAAAPREPQARNGEVNLEQWLKGEARYVSTQVFAAIRARYSRSVTTFAEAVHFLVFDAKLIPLREVAPKLRPKADA